MSILTASRFCDHHLQPLSPLYDRAATIQHLGLVVTIDAHQDGIRSTIPQEPMACISRSCRKTGTITAASASQYLSQQIINRQSICQSTATINATDTDLLDLLSSLS
jgi:hypothetical protein